MTVFVIDRLSRNREEQEARIRLIHEVGSKDNATTLKAIHKIRERGWLSGDDGVLRRGRLSGVNLEGANLHAVNLEGAHLSLVNLEGANLSYANFKGADLQYANLKGVYLYEANLEDTNLSGVNFRDANLNRVKFNEKVVLPDSAYNFKTKTYDKYWTPDTDMTRYTNPDHPRAGRGQGSTAP